MAISTAAAIGGAAVLGAGASIIGGNKAASASRAAADTAAGAQNEATALQKAIFEQQRADLTSQRVIGNEALYRLADLNNLRRPITNDAIPSDDFAVTTGRFGGAALPVLGGQPTAFAGQQGVTIGQFAPTQTPAATQQGQAGANFIPLGYNPGSAVTAADLGINFNAQQPADPRRDVAGQNEFMRRLGFNQALDEASRLSGAARDAYIAEFMRNATLNNTFNAAQRPALESVLRSGLNSQQFASNNFRFQVPGTQQPSPSQSGQATLPVLQAGASGVATPTSQQTLGAFSGQNNSAQVNPYSGFMESPDYRFRLSEGNKALDRAFAARGLSNSGAEYKALSRWNQDAASQEYGANYNRLAALAGIGQTATAQSNAAAGAYAANAGQGITNAGMIRAQGGLQAAGAQSQGYLNAFGSLSQSNLFSGGNRGGIVELGNAMPWLA
jgi:hypothetical protein